LAKPVSVFSTHRRRRERRKKKRRKKSPEATFKLQSVSKFEVELDEKDIKLTKFKWTVKNSMEHEGDAYVVVGEAADDILDAINDSIKIILTERKVKNPDKVLEKSGLATPRTAAATASPRKAISTMFSPRKNRSPGGSPSASKKEGKTMKTLTIKGAEVDSEGSELKKEDEKEVKGSSKKGKKEKEDKKEEEEEEEKEEKEDKKDEEEVKEEKKKEVKGVKGKEKKGEGG